MTPALMRPPSSIRRISQQAFDDMVRENIDDFGLDPAEALSDVIHTLSLQAVDISGIVTCVPGVTNIKDNPVVQCLDLIRRLDSDLTNPRGDLHYEEARELFEQVAELCFMKGNAEIATRNGAVELTCSICSKFRVYSEMCLVSILKALASFLHDVQSRDTFQKNGGPKFLISILRDGYQNLNILSSGFSVVSASATGNEIVKDSFMDLKIDELIIEVMNVNKESNIQSLYESIHILLTADDDRVVASQVYGYARRFAKLGVADALVESINAELSSSSLISTTFALKAVAVNDEICRSIAEKNGIKSVLQCLDHSCVHGSIPVARACCSLLSKLAVSDSIKNEIVEKGGLDILMKISATFCEDPSVLQEVMWAISVICLRSPMNAGRALESGAGDLAIQAMRKFPTAHQMQKNSCLMIRNLVARNPENRAVLLNNGVEKVIRNAKDGDGRCRVAAIDALRDLGVDDYNA